MTSKSEGGISIVDTGGSCRFDSSTGLMGNSSRREKIVPNVQENN